MKRFIVLLVMLAVLIAASCAQAAVVADSQASFIGVQGNGAWNWMVWDGVGNYTTSSASLCPYWADWSPPVGNGGWYNPEWFGIHIYGYVQQVGFSGTPSHDNWAITRWTSTVSSPVKISMSLSAYSSNDKGKGHLWINGSEVWSQVLSSGAPVTYDYYTTLNAGDLVDFGSDSQGEVRCDLLATYKVDTQAVPEPGSLLALGSGFLGFVGLVIRRRK